MAHRLYPNVAVVPNGQQPVYSTSEVSHFYVDGTSGDDANDGLTLGTPKKTLEGIMAVIPDVINHHTVVHLSGTIDLQTSASTIYMTKTVAANGVTLLFDGGDGVVAAALGSTGLSITSAGTDFITSSGAGWTVDQWKGVWVKIGTQIRMIQSNTSDTLVPTFAFSPVPSGTFDIVVPETTVTSTSTRVWVFSCPGVGYCNVQRLSLTGGVRLYARAQAQCSVNGIVSKNTSTYAFYAQSADVGFWPYLNDPQSPSSLIVFNVGCSFLGRINLSSEGNFVSVQSVIAQTAMFYGCAVVRISDGCRFENVVFDACSIRESAILGSNFKNVIDGASSVGILLNGVVGHSYFVANTWEIKNCASHGLEAIGSTVSFLGDVTGSGNGGVGLYAHSGSQVDILGTSPPTVTGSLGDVAINDSDLVTPISWSAIVSEGGIASAEQSTAIKVS